MSIYLETEYVPVHCGGGDNGKCDQQFAMTRSFYDETRRTGKGWFCPNGHRRVWSGSTTEQKLAESQARETHMADQLRAAVEDAELTRVALLRDRQRFANGVCPCCNRSFENVRRHMAGEHPDYDVTKIKQTSTVRFKCGCGMSFETLRGLRTHQGHMRTRDWSEPGVSRWSSHLTTV